MPDDAYTPLEEAARAALADGYTVMTARPQDVVELIGKAREGERLRAEAQEAVEYLDEGSWAMGRQVLRNALAPREEGE